MSYLRGNTFSKLNAALLITRLGICHDLNVYGVSQSTHMLNMNRRKARLKYNEWRTFENINLVLEVDVNEL